jgi:protein-S-isoprenylcysteine O-methyltransferase Ste14
MVTPAPRWLIECGNFFFKHRNRVFPAFFVIIALAIQPRLWTSEASDHAIALAGVALALAGQAFRALVIGLAYIKRGGVNKKVYAEKLVTEGIFSACRNPLYFGNALIIAGLLLMFNSPAGYVIGVVFFAFAYWSIIRTEETYLLQKFGDDYAAYCRDVNRWWPDPRRVVRALQGASFNWRRVLMKDYGTLAAWLISAIAIGAYEAATRESAPMTATLAPYVGQIVLVLALALAVRQAKKSGLLTERT